jgi:hypothetical protein
VRTAILLGCLLAAFALPASAQTPPGRIVGRVLDAASGQPIPGARVALLATTMAVRSDPTGRYTLLQVPAGTHAVSVRTIGYAEKTVRGVLVEPNAVVALNISLAVAAVEMAGIEVTADAARGSVAHALVEQRAAIPIVTTVPAEVIRRSPDSDAGQAVQRVSGVTVQDGKYVFVRGLGERYTTTSLNNARIPSPEPERRVVPLDLFPSSLLQSIVTSKTFTPEQPGDFTGAQVDLRTREFPTTRTFSVSTSVGVNDAATGRDVLAAPRLGPEWFGYAGAARALPAAARAAGDLSGLPQDAVNNVITSFRNAWTPWNEQAKPNVSFGLSLGGEDIVAGRPLGYVGSLTYSESQDIRRGERRATTSYGGVPDSAIAVDTARGATGTMGVQWGGLLNLTTRLGGGVIALHNTYTRSLDNQATRHIAWDEEYSPGYGLFEVSRLTLVERTMRSNQLRGEHALASRHNLAWSVTWSGVRRYEPDRSDLRYETAIDPATGQPVATAWAVAGHSAVRTFADLAETSLEAQASLALVFGRGEGWRVKVGGLSRSVNRDADTRAYQIVNLRLSDAQRRAAAEQIFAGAYALDSAFILIPDVALGRYRAEDALTAGFAQLELPLSDRIRVIGGARVERWALDLAVRTTRDTVIPRRNTDVLPALSVNVALSAAHSLRLSGSQTVSRPEYREIVPVGYREFIGGFDVFGNPALRRALVRNLDARWEWYPGAGELISVGAFAKWFDRPIEKVVQGVAGADALTFLNAAGASSYGVELDIRRNLVSVAPALAPFSVFANATLMRSRIQPGAASLTHANRSMVGQSQYVVNGGLGYAAASGLSATVLYNVAGPRITEAGTGGIPDAYEQARHMLDLSLQAPLFGTGVSLKLDSKNLLDAPVRITQGSITRLAYTTGRVFSLGASWQP